MLDAWRPQPIEVLAFLAAPDRAELRLRFAGDDQRFHLHNVAVALWVQQMGAVHQRWLHADTSKRSLVTMLRFSIACRAPVWDRDVVVVGALVKTRPMRGGLLNICRFDVQAGAITGEATFHYLPAEAAVRIAA